jgi:S1-C subfamily serine protease
MFSSALGWIMPSVVKIAYEKNKVTTSTGTGFFFRGLLVTNFHVYNPPEGRDVRITFALDYEDVVVSDLVFHDSIIHASGENEFDYAFFDPHFLPKERKTLLNRLSIRHFKLPEIGDEVGIAGYPFGKPRMTGHLCRISSIFKSGPATMFQLEGSINAANSGGPLFNLQEKALIGIVTRKEHGLTNRFQPLVESLKRNVRDYDEKGFFGDGTNAKVQKALLDAQRNMLALTQELERSSNTGIGYAIAIDHLLGDSEFVSRSEPDPVYGPSK